MDITVTKRINPTTQITIKFDGERDLKEAVLKATPFMQLSEKCGCCGSDDITLQARPTHNSEFTYLEMTCRKCHAQQSFGEYKTPKGAFFLKPWKKYIPKEENK